MPVNNSESISVLHIITRLDRGGSAEIVLELARLLKEDGYTTGIVSGKTVDPHTDIDIYSGNTAIPVLFIEQLVRNVSPLKDILAFFKIRREIIRFKPDIVHTHTSKAGILGRFAAWTAGIRSIVHTPHGHIFYGYYGKVTTYFFVLMERLAALITSSLVVLTTGGKKDHLHKKIGSEELFAVIPSGVDVARFRVSDGGRVREETGWRENRMVGWVGRLVPVKDCGTFISAASLISERLPDTRFLVAGDGFERQKMENLVRQLGLENRLVLLGDRKDVPSIMAALDVFVLSSLNEGFGRVLIEAMASGAAVVSTKVGGTIDVIEDGISGVLVPPGNPESMADAVCTILMNESLRLTLRENGLLRAQLFDVHKTVQSYEKVYETVLHV